MTDALARDARQRILDEFIERHGKWDARVFYNEVRATGGQHEAWTWFTWDNEKAADEYRIWQARTFIRDLVVRFSVETVEHGKVTVRSVEAPRVISPLASRQHGGGYIAVDPNNPDVMAAFCAEAARSLQSWFTRYEAALAYAGAKGGNIRKIVGLLEAKSSQDEAA